MTTRLLKNHCATVLMSCITLMAAVGCGGSPGSTEAGDDLASVSSPILSSPTTVTTTDKPAIGQLILASSGALACTATLISSRVILTAAHCFGWNTGGSGFGSASSPPTFPTNNSSGLAFKDGTGAVRQLRRYAVKGTAGGSDDIAVAELESDVSWSSVHWLSVATSPAADMSQVSAWGYGCTSSYFGNTMVACGTMGDCKDGGYCFGNQCWNTIAADYGTKRMVTTTWDSTKRNTRTNVTCGGDSGGPILDASGNIIAVNSAGPWDLAVPGSDTPADAVFHRPFISRVNAIFGKRQICDTCPQVAFRTFDNMHYLQAVNGGAGAVVATPTAVGTWETFYLVQFANQYSPFIGLQSSTTGRWMAAVNGGGAGVIDEANFPGTWEVFKLTSDSKGAHLSTIGASPMFVSAEGGGGGAVNANRMSASDWESFTFLTRVPGSFQ
jgi:V8-like Glu-specific endopeptidase